ncbi:hypothetical protein SMC26_17880 [Actinomadura fulvescens]|uniref:PASTA domain-containing protein n=1 Tax=Actinomadura fulvescens TaxID=46160 RepID=A0ABN3PXR9_9ACTN
MGVIKRHSVGIVIGALLACLALSSAVVIYLFVSMTGCEYSPKKLEAVREVVEADIAGLHTKPVELVAICDSGDAPFLETDLAPGVAVDEAVRRLQGKGWQVIESIEPDEGYGGKSLQKRYRGKVVHLFVERVNNGSMQISL